MSPLGLGAHKRRVAGFAVLGNSIPIVVATATDIDSHHAAFYVGAAAACVAPLVVSLGSRKHRIPFYAAAYGGLVALTAMQSYTGGIASGYSILLMMAMIWFGLQATDRELLAGLGVLAMCAVAPMLIFGAPAYPVSWGHAAIAVLVGSTVAGSLRALTREVSRLTHTLRNQARVDDLTGILNRRGWRETAPRELTRGARNRTPVCLVLVDLDRFKTLNDTQGHAEGDRVLRETAERLTESLRASDVVARLGGDEFVALLPDSSLGGAIGTVNRLRRLTPEVGAFSAGVALWDGDEDLDELTRRCDLALYAAKRSGRSAVEIAPEPIDGVPDPAQARPDARLPLKDDERQRRQSLADSSL